MRRNSYWTAPPGSPSRSGRNVIKIMIASFLVGVMSIGLAWAGATLVPISDKTQTTATDKQGNWLQASSQSSSEESAAQVDGTQEPLQANQVYAGASKVSINPNPEKYHGTWEQNRAHCETLGSPQETEPQMIPDFRVRWHENTNCIYTGGYDLGPANAVGDYDREYELWARATAVSDGKDTLVLMELDGTYYFAKYANMCNTDPTFKSAFDGDGPGANQYTQDCGFRDLQNSMAAKYGYTAADNRGKFGIEPSSFFLTSSHAHAAADFIGAWGGVPRWYMQQTEDAIRQAVYEAIDTMRPAFVEAGEILYRGGNNSRRGHYHAAEESTEAWMRFVSETPSEPVCTTPPAPTGPPGQVKKSPAPTPTCTTPPPNKAAIATIGTYAAHPVDHSNGVLYADLAAVFAKRAEERFGGVGLFFQTGFGNMSSSIGRRELGKVLVDLIPAVGAGSQVLPQAKDNPDTPGDDSFLDVRTTQRFFDQPVTNSALAGGGISGIFDRPMESRPSAVSISKDSLQPTDPQEHLPYKRCNSASPVTVNSSVSIGRIGPLNGGLLVTGGPGELFSNLTNTIKEKSIGTVALPISLVNDGLGYIMQSFETDHLARQVVGFANGPLSEYEDAYSIDACFGDHVLEQTLAGMRSI